MQLKDRNWFQRLKNDNSLDKTTTIIACRRYSRRKSTMQACQVIVSRDAFKALKWLCLRANTRGLNLIHSDPLNVIYFCLFVCLFVWLRAMIIWSYLKFRLMTKQQCNFSLIFIQETHNEAEIGRWRNLHPCFKSPDDNEGDWAKESENWR